MMNATNTDITGYGRKMGRDADGIEGRINDVVVVDGERLIAGTYPYRTINPANTESAGGGGLVGNYSPANQSWERGTQFQTKNGMREPSPEPIDG